MLISAQGARTGDTSKNPPILSIGVKIDIIKYAGQEWKGQTPKSEAIRKVSAHLVHIHM